MKTFIFDHNYPIRLYNFSH